MQPSDNNYYQHINLLTQQQQQHLSQYVLQSHFTTSGPSTSIGTSSTSDSKIDEDDDDDDSGLPGKKSGRRKIKIEYITDKSRRHITFSKRKAGIMKKAYELSTLTGTQLLLLVVSETGLVYTFTTPKLQPLVTKPEGKKLIESCLNAPDPGAGEVSTALNFIAATPSTTITNVMKMPSAGGIANYTQSQHHQFPSQSMQPSQSMLSNNSSNQDLLTSPIPTHANIRNSSGGNSGNMISNRAITTANIYEDRNEQAFGNNTMTMNSSLPSNKTEYINAQIAPGYTPMGFASGPDYGNSVHQANSNSIYNFNVSKESTDDREQQYVSNTRIRYPKY